MGGDLWRAGVTGVILVCVVQAAVAAAADGGDAAQRWQYERLFEPTRSQLRQEQSGAVFIYDGIEYDTVERAMDVHFDRIQHMMFTRIHHPPPAGGEAYVEDDGCD